MKQPWKWVKQGRALVPLYESETVAWAAQKGAQDSFLRCTVPEVLLEGNRGGGKTDALLMDFAQHVGKGFGAEWRGILFRHTYRELEDVIAKSKKWFPRFSASATFNSSKSYWGWPSGERLFLSYMERDSDYQGYHGHEYTWIAFEELTTWPTDKCYKVMMSIWRTPHPDIPLKFRATCNPYGPGHNWVKKRFRLPLVDGDVVGPIIKEEGNPPPPARCAIHSSLLENKILMTSNPDYLSKIVAGARNDAERKAWVEGSWDIVAGGMFDDVWQHKFHLIPPLHASWIPQEWRIDRSFDWGSSAPFSVGWWAESDGCDLYLPDRDPVSTVRGDLFRVAEWYGSTGEPNEGLRMLASNISKGIIQRELAWGMHGRTRPGVADSSIFNVENGMSIATDMGLPVRIGAKQYNGTQWLPADKRKGSRQTGWELMRERFENAVPKVGCAREYPGIFICSNCHDFVRTVPVLPRDLEKNPDDVDTDAEDHIADETRYRIRFSTQRLRSGRTVGV